MSALRETSRCRDLAMSLAIIGALLLGGTYGPVDDPQPEAAADPEVAGVSLQTFWRATMLEIHASWRGIFGEAQNSGYQLYASMGNVTNADVPAQPSAVNGDLGPLFPLR